VIYNICETPAEIELRISLDVKKRVFPSQGVERVETPAVYASKLLNASCLF
jgi:hypothetical protein